MNICKALIETMKETICTYLVFGAVVALTLIMFTGCGGGGFPDGDQTITITNTQAQDNNQNQSTGTETCTDSCQIDASSGDIVQVRECEGSPITIVASFATTGDCRSGVEAAAVADQAAG